MPKLTLPLEVTRLKLGSDLDFGIDEHRIWTALEPLNGFIDRLNLPDPIPCGLIFGAEEELSINL